MDDLTDRQTDTLRYIARGIANGFAPTLREIGDALGIRSTNGVSDHLRALQKKGYLLRDGLKSRALRLTHKAREFLGMAPAGESDRDRDRAALLEAIYRAVREFQAAREEHRRADALARLDTAVEQLRLHDARSAA